MFVSDKHYFDLDIYLDDLREKLTSTFLELLHTQHGINLWVAVHVRYTNPTKVLGNSDSIVLHSGPNIVTSPLVLERKLDSLIDTLP